MDREEEIKKTLIVIYSLREKLIDLALQMRNLDIDSMKRIRKIIRAMESEYEKLEPSEIKEVKKSIERKYKREKLSRDS